MRLGADLERALQDIFAVQEELTQAIAATVTPHSRRQN